MKLGFTLKFALAKVNTKQHRRKYELPCRMPWVQQHYREVRHVCESKSGLSCQRMMLPTSSTRLDQTKREWRGGYIQRHHRNTAKNWSFRQPCHPIRTGWRPIAGLRPLHTQGEYCVGPHKNALARENLRQWSQTWITVVSLLFGHLAALSRWLWGGMKFWLMTVWKEKRTPQGPTKCAFCQVLMEHSHQCCHSLSALRSIRSTWSRQLFWPTATKCSKKWPEGPICQRSQSVRQKIVQSTHLLCFWIHACDPKLTKRSTCKNHEDICAGRSSDFVS